MKKALKKVSKAIKKKAAGALKKVKSVRLPKLSGQAKLALAGIAVIAAGLGSFKAYQTVRANAFKDGCVDGAAIGMTSILGPIVGDMFLANKDKMFSRDCGKLSGAYVMGKRVGGESAGEEQEQEEQKPQGGGQDQKDEE